MPLWLEYLLNLEPIAWSFFRIPTGPLTLPQHTLKYFATLWLAIWLAPSASASRGHHRDLFSRSLSPDDSERSLDLNLADATAASIRRNFYCEWYLNLYQIRLILPLYHPLLGGLVVAVYASLVIRGFTWRVVRRTIHITMVATVLGLIVALASSQCLFSEHVQAVGIPFLSASSSTSSPTISRTATISQTATTITASPTSGSVSHSTSSSASAVQPVSSPLVGALSPLSGDLLTVHTRRLDFIAASVLDYDQVSNLLNTQTPDGTWPDVDYTTGCPAQRANWPAATHWSHINTLAAAYHGNAIEVSDPTYVNSTAVRTIIDRAIDWWFSRDYTNINCIDQGNTTSCPCSTPGMWNTNWFSNVILVPRSVGQVCLLLRDAVPALTSTQASNCTNFTARSFGRFGTGAGYLSGANILDIASIGVSSALIQANADTMTSAYNYVHSEVILHDAVKVDGIHGDGSFQQHGGIIYNGNYGKDYTNDILALEIQAAGTQWAAPANSASQNAFLKHVDGFQWMIFKSVLTNILHWDISVIGRFIAFPVADTTQAAASILVNLTQIAQLGTLWNQSSLSDIANRLQQSSSNANVGGLVGNRMFSESDYMVHRSSGAVTTLRMYSNRTENSECVNNANPLGFHLADGTVYTYTKGGEYEDVAASWDWNLIPGTTVDYGATALSCSTTTKTGVQSFVGGASDGKVGIAVMSYTNPTTKALTWKKAWFFLEDGTQKVAINSITSTSNPTQNPVLTVLDQKRHSGSIYANSALVTPPSTGNTSLSNIKSLWHDNVGYTFDSISGYPAGLNISISAGQKTGSWSAIGTSTQPPTTVDLYAAWIRHAPATFNSSISYTIFPATPYSGFAAKQKQAAAKFIGSPSSDLGILATTPATTNTVLDATRGTALIVYWASTGGTVSVPFDGTSQPSINITSNHALALIVRRGKQITVSDPSQTLKTAIITIVSTVWAKTSISQRIQDIRVGVVDPKGKGKGAASPVPLVASTKTVTVTFPTATPGSSVTVQVA